MTRPALALASAFGLAACATVPTSEAIRVSSLDPDCPAIGGFLDSAVAEGRTVGASTLI